MRQSKHLVAAIDIGTTKIVALAGRKNEFGKLEVIGLTKTESKGVRRGVVLNIEEAVQSIKIVVDDLATKHNITFSNVFVGIAGQHIRSVQNRDYLLRDSLDTEISTEDVQKLMQNMYKTTIDSDEEILHVIPQSYTVDNELCEKNPVGICGKRLEGNFHIVIGKIASANNIRKCIHRVNLAVSSLILEPLASSQSVLTDDEKEVGVALVDIGGGTTDIAVFHEGIIRHTAVIAFGGNVITKDIKEGLGIIEKHAELLKVQYGSALAETTPQDSVVTIPGINGRPSKEVSLRTLAYIIQSRMEEIIGAVQFEIESSGFHEKLGAGIVVTGGGALLKSLPQLIAFKTGMDVRIGLPNEHLAGNVKDDISHPMYSTAIGLLLMGYDSMEKEFKKLDEEQMLAEENEIAENTAQAETNIPEPETETKIDKTKEKKKKQKDGNMFKTLGQAFTKIFEDDENIK
jgi:cell division protein FtsA